MIVTFECGYSKFPGTVKMLQFDYGVRVKNKTTAPPGPNRS